MEVCAQPSWIAFNRKTRSVKAFGEEAFNIQGKNHWAIETIKPLSGGVIANFSAAKTMVGEMVKYSLSRNTRWLGFNNIISGVPLHTTDVERHAFMDTLEQFHTRNRFLMFEPVAAAIGLGLNIEEPRGKMLIDIGGGITEMVIFSMFGVASFKSVKAGGDSMDEAIQDYVRKQFGLLIGLGTAERIKKSHAAAIPGRNREYFMVEGKDMATGIPSARKVSSYDLFDAINPIIEKIELTLIKTLEECTPELAGDLYVSGIHVTGGCSVLPGLKERFENKTGLRFYLETPQQSAVSLGISIAMEDVHRFKHLLVE